MKKILWGVLTFFYVVFCSHTLFERTVEYQSCKGEGASVIPLERGNWLVFCEHSCEGNPDSWNSSLIQINEHGDTSWTKKKLSFNGIMKQTPSGKLVFAGADLKSKTAKLFLTTLKGQIIWERSLFNTLCNHTITDILPSTDGFIVTGTFSDDWAQPAHRSYVAKLDSKGNPVWKHIANGSSSQQIQSVKVLKDKTIAAFGWTFSTAESNDADYLLVKLTPDGNLIWSKSYGDDRDNYGYSMDVTSDGGFIISGYSETVNATRLNREGNIVWSVALGEACSERHLKSIAMPGGEFIFLTSELDDNQKYKSILIKADADGNLVWRKSFDAKLRDFSAVGNSYVMAGYTEYPSGVYVVKFDSIQTTHNDNIAFIPDGEIESDEDVSGVTVYQNPSQSSFTIEFNNPSHSSYSVDVFDTNGKSLFSKGEVTSNKISIEREIFGNGLFNLVLNGDGKAINGKLLLQ